MCRTLCKTQMCTVILLYNPLFLICPVGFKFFRKSCQFDDNLYLFGIIWNGRKTDMFQNSSNSRLKCLEKLIWTLKKLMYLCVAYNKPFIIFRNHFHYSMFVFIKAHKALVDSWVLQVMYLQTEKPYKITLTNGNVLKCGLSRQVYIQISSFYFIHVKYVFLFLLYQTSKRARNIAWCLDVRTWFMYWLCIWIINA